MRDFGNGYNKKRQNPSKTEHKTESVEKSTVKGNGYNKKGQNPSKTEQNRAQNGKRGKVNRQRSTKVKPDKIEAKKTKNSRKPKKRD
nr:hypothetical protein [Tanacetum cinerariifolium]